jgi:catechol 2,3-dioxygenase-like lactoylglutathione lyase family enzyme
MTGCAMSVDTEKPKFLAVDHISRTVSDLESALDFYIRVIGAELHFRLGPIDAADLPKSSDGRDWMAAHVGVAGARLTLAMLRLPQGSHFQLVQYDKPTDRNGYIPRNCDLGGHHLALRVDNVDKAVAYLSAHGCKALETIEIDSGPLAGKKNVYVLDPFGQQLEIVD